MPRPCLPKLGRQFAGVLLVSIFTGPGFAVEVTDIRGQQIHLIQPAKRIIALAPFLTELLFAAGAGDRAVGVVEFSDFPAAANGIPRIGSHQRFDMEAILALKPDLVVAWLSGNTRSDLDRLEQLGLQVYVSEPGKLDDIPDVIDQLGKLAGTERFARRSGQTFRKKLWQLKKQYQGLSGIRLFYQIWEQPLMTVNGDHLINDVIRLCGGKNVFEALPSLTPIIDIEAVIQADPAVIVTGGMSDAGTTWLKTWQQWPQLSAVKSGNLVFIPPSLIQRHTPRILEGARQLCVALDQARKRIPKEPLINPPDVTPAEAGVQ
jgi:iron complex transport system substrate-binding protein